MSVGGRWRLAFALGGDPVTKFHCSVMPVTALRPGREILAKGIADRAILAC